MAITALILGKLIADPEVRTGQSGKPFTLARMAASTEDGDALVSVIAFGTTGQQLAVLGKGESVALTGRAKVTTWAAQDGSARAGLSLTADALLTVHHVRRKRRAMAGEEQEPSA